MTDTDETKMLPAWHAANAMDMIDAFRDLGCRIGHGVTEDPEIVLGPVVLPGGKALFCSMSLHDTGWSYWFSFDDFGLPSQTSITGEAWELPEELKAALRAVVAASAMEASQ